tara:strand:+ start:861 stop:1328 length:468 start_codon:yes stop_codon:yes gene_type:complete
MENASARVFSIIGDKRFYIVLITAAIFIIAALYVWYNYVNPQLNQSYVPNKEYVNKEDDPDIKYADLYYFYTTWCPHCKSSRPEWNKFKEKIGDKKVNGVRINFMEVDCDKDTATANKFKIEGYPTIKLVNNGRIVEYDAKPDSDTLQQFLKASL